MSNWFALSDIYICDYEIMTKKENTLLSAVVVDAGVVIVAAVVARGI